MLCQSFIQLPPKKVITLIKADCRWSLWTKCKVCEGGNQERRITRKRGCDETGRCGEECKDTNLTKRPCNNKNKCIDNPQSK